MRSIDILRVAVRKFFAPAVAFLLLGAAANATVVRFETVLGNVDVRLYDTATPLTSANFLSYVDANDWDDTFIHRSVPDFVVQGGGFTFDNSTGVSSVPQNPAVQNEPGITNTRGTVAMAKLGGDPNSATNQWFFNLADNSGNLDNQNGGFTVFGRVLGDGMTIVDAIAALPRVNAGAPFDTIPVIDWTPGNPILDENLVNLSTIRRLDVPDGDYNFDGVVDVADYTVWRDTLGSTTSVEADGNGDGVVNAADYTVWANDFGVASSAFAVPEPGALCLMGLAWLVAPRRK